VSTEINWRDLAEWNLTLNRDADGRASYDALQTAILWSIRAELRKLNAVLACANFQRLPADLAAIRRNTAKPKPKKKAKVKQ